MRRKSERNKAKGSPEKKVEKPTRRITRRRGRASSPVPVSSERESTDDNVSSTPYSEDDRDSQLQADELDNETVTKDISSSELIKSVLGGGDEEDNVSVWKVARADASPGEIQKLKLCRQRNISETSDSSLSKTKSNKWPDSGEGGTEEADSVDEQVASSQMTTSEQTDDPSSSHPGQDSSEEVSDYKENLPETTTANLSDDQTNIDQQADYKENLHESTSINYTEQPLCEDNQSTSSTNLPADNLMQSSYANNIVEPPSENSTDPLLDKSFQDISYQQPGFDLNVTEPQSTEANLNTPSDCTSAIDGNNFSTSHDCTFKNNENDISTSEECTSAKDENNFSAPDECAAVNDENNVGISDNCTAVNDNIGNETIPTEQSTVEISSDVPADEPITLCEDNTSIEDSTPKQDSILNQETLYDESISEIVLINNETNDTDFAESRKEITNDDEEEEEEEGEIRDEPEKETSPDTDSTANTEESPVVEDEVGSSKVKIRSSRRKHDKYCESSPDAPESEGNIQNDKEIDSTSTENIKLKSKREKKNEKSKSDKIRKDSVSKSSEIDVLDASVEKEDILEITEKSDDLNVSLTTSKPTKISLKRSFSKRLSIDSETKKEETTIKKATSSDSNQNKENHVDNEQPDQKKRRRWGVTATDVAPAFSISTDSLKALVPGAKPVPANEVKLTKDEDEEKERRKRKTASSPDDKSKTDITTKTDSIKKGESKTDNHIAPRRKITLVKETPRPKSPSPPEAQATNILLIRNLVRPFTLNQIKELLSRTGTIVENGFWMDRIKSKCYVEYANEDQAFETRQALHGISWPQSNPKKLIVEYAEKEDMEAARESSKEQPAQKKTDPLIASADLWQQDSWSREDRPTVVNKITVIREWDVGKEDGQLSVKEKERERKELEKKKRQRSRSPIAEVHLPAPARKFKKKEEEPPTAKLLDDLFKKTKATPCIYWLPLTSEQIAVKEEIRRQHMAEHARRLEDMRRRRRRSPRK